MALNLITNPPSLLVVDTDWTNFLTRENKSNIGTGLSIPIFTLTNWDASTTIPAIAEGSIIEVGGSLYQADSDTALTLEGGIIDGTVHIKLIPGAGSPDPLTVVPTLTNDALPAWDAVKAGWYTGANKYLPFEMTKASAVYTTKGQFIDQNKLTKRNSDGKLILTGQMEWKSYFKASNITYGALYTEFTTNWITGDGSMSCVGQLKKGSDFGSISELRILGIGTIVKIYYKVSTTEISISLTSGDGTILDDIELMSNFDQIS